MAGGQWLEESSLSLLAALSRSTALTFTCNHTMYGLHVLYVHVEATNPYFKEFSGFRNSSPACYKAALPLILSIVVKVHTRNAGCVHVPCIYKSVYYMYICMCTVIT